MKIPTDWKILEGDDLSRRWRLMGLNTTAPIKFYMNQDARLTIQINETKTTENTPWEGSLRVGIRVAKKNDPSDAKELRVSWSTIQEIKDQFWPEQIAIEIFPPINQIVDASAMRWLWVLPKGAVLPFNLCSDTKNLCS